MTQLQEQKQNEFTKDRRKWNDSPEKFSLPRELRVEGNREREFIERGKKTPNLIRFGNEMGPTVRLGESTVQCVRLGSDATWWWLLSKVKINCARFLIYLLTIFKSLIFIIFSFAFLVLWLLIASKLIKGSFQNFSMLFTKLVYH